MRTIILKDEERPAFIARVSGTLEFLRPDGSVRVVELTKGTEVLIELFFATPNLETTMIQFAPTTIFRKPSLDHRFRIFGACRFKSSNRQSYDSQTPV